MRLKLLITALFAVFSMSLAGSCVLAFNPLGAACQNAPTNPACAQNKIQNGSSTNPAVDLVQKAANIIAVVAGLGAVIVIIISGFMFVTSGGTTPGQRSGDPNAVKKARSALFGAIIGLVIIVLAWTIVTFVNQHFVTT